MREQLALFEQSKEAIAKEHAAAWLHRHPRPPASCRDYDNLHKKWLAAALVAAGRLAGQGEPFLAALDIVEKGPWLFIDTLRAV